jgi:hypothetical protein
VNKELYDLVSKINENKKSSSFIGYINVYENEVTFNVD